MPGRPINGHLRRLYERRERALFPRPKVITRQGKRIEFDAQMGRLQFAQSFYVDYQGKFEP